MKKMHILSTTPASGIGSRLILTAALIIAAYYRASGPFFLLALLLAYLLWSYFWALMSSRFTVIESIQIPTKIFTGEHFCWNFKFKNSSFFPIVRCGIKFLLPGELAVSNNIEAVPFGPNDEENKFLRWNCYTSFYAWLPGKHEADLSVKVEAPLRGIYFLPAVYFYAGDPSGLFQGLTQISREQYLFVFPRLEKPHELMKMVDLTDNYRKSNYGPEDPYQINGIRNYQPGDHPKSINWYAAARTGSIKTNLYQRNDTEHCLVVLDLTVSPQPSYIPIRKRGEEPLTEKAISIAAGVALFQLSKGIKTAFYTNAPLLQWIKTSNTSKNSLNTCLRRTAKITTLEFCSAKNQSSKILELCASIDETSRGNDKEQLILWSAITQCPAATVIYLVCCNTPPVSWKQDSNYNKDFYTPQRLSALPSARIHLIDISKCERKDPK